MMMRLLFIPSCDPQQLSLDLWCLYFHPLEYICNCGLLKTNDEDIDTLNNPAENLAQMSSI